MTTENERHTFRLYPSGAEFDPFAPDWRLLRPEDVAHSLSSMARFAGYTPEPYMVGQHAVIVSEMSERLARLGPPSLKNTSGRMLSVAGKRLAPGEILRGMDHRMWGRAGLMHEVAESHGGFPDPIGPIKRHPMFQDLFYQLSYRIEMAASRAWDLPSRFAHSDIVKAADHWAYAWEDRDLRGATPPPELAALLPEHKLVPWTWQECRQRFMDRWHLVKPLTLPAPTPDDGRGAWE